LYDYLLTGSREGDVLLDPGDTIFVPAMRGEVGLAGEVRRPARYEIKGELTISGAVEMAGGLTSAAYGPVVDLWRPDARREWMLTTIDLATPSGPDLGRAVQDGDLLVVRSLLPSAGNTVKLVGAVKRPGYYPVDAFPTVSALIEAAEGLAGPAHVGMGVIRRPDAERHYRIISFNVADALAGVPGADPSLLAKDIVEVFYQDEMEPAFAVRVDGAVTRPGVYRWSPDLTVSQLLQLAGGALPGAYMERADLLRLTLERTWEVIPVNLRAALAGEPGADVDLRRGDVLQVNTREEAGLKDRVNAAGFVNKPGPYARREGMKVSDLIFAAGGLAPGAGPTIELVRGHFEGAPTPIELQLIGEGEDYRVEPDMVLEDDDSVSVAGRGEFKVRADLVQLQGHVQRPGSYAIKSGTDERAYTVYDLIEEGGGLLADANPAGIVVYRRRGSDVGDAQSEDLQRVLKAVNREAQQPSLQISPDQQQAAMAQTVSAGIQQVVTNPGSLSIVLPPRPVQQEDLVSAIPVNGEELLASRGREGNLELQPADTVMVPRRVNTVMVLGAVPRSGAVPFIAAYRCRDYLTESGGMREDAAPARLIVVHANGSVAPIRLASEVGAGDIIVVPTRHVVRTVRTESDLRLWLRNIVPVAAAALLVK
ncbi:MAG TPA: SLBB domain-containing protein, partial [Armatimonadota bacterium]|nr:SLBB domain-containing protein [Armatimonadota bacterium]